MPLFDTYAASKAGPTGTLGFDAVTPVRLQMLPSVATPTMLMLRSTADVYLRQGGPTITAAATDFVLISGLYFPILVESPLDIYLSALGVSGTGTVFITNATDLITTPNSG